MVRSTCIALFLVLSTLAASAQQPGVVQTLEAKYESAAEKAATCVVSVKVTREGVSKPAPTNNPFQTGGPFAARPSGAPCSGVVIDADGYILTTYFNIRNDAKDNGGAVKEIEVTLPDGAVHKGTLIGFHQDADLGLIKIEATGLACLTPTNLGVLKTGTSVIALGRGPDSKGLTVNPGIVSAPGRLHNRGVQIDCKLNYGNVGGALVDLEGRLVGLTCKVDSKPIPAATFGQNSGVSFAVTCDKIAELLPDLKKGLKTTGTGLPFLGVRPDQEFGGEGVRLAAIEPGSAAEVSGLKIGDTIVELDGKKTRNFEELRGVIIKKAIGDKVKVIVLRNVVKEDKTEELKEVDIEVIMGERPGD